MADIFGCRRNWPTFPQLYKNGELVGGLDIVKEELETDPNFFAEFSVANKAKGKTTAPQARLQSATST